jgi:hypothetical protein
MKTVRFILISFFLQILFSSCKKDNQLSITGKWITQEYYNGYGDGGDFKWHAFDDQYKDTIEFTSDGHYLQGTYPGSCNGTYTVTNHDINYITPCGSNTISFYFEYLPNSLIISHIVREGIIKIKYIKVN